MSNAEGYVLPKPGIPKTLGILNIIFGVLLVLYGLCTVGSLLAAPAMMQFAENTVKDVQNKAEVQRKAQIKTYDDRIAAATTEEEKKAIEQERAVAANSRRWLPRWTCRRPPTCSRTRRSWASPTPEMGTGLILHIMLLISGIGLIRLTPWGRTLGLWWAGLQIVQVVILLAVSIVVVQPISKPRPRSRSPRWRPTPRPGGPPDRSRRTVPR